MSASPMSSFLHVPTPGTFLLQFCWVGALLHHRVLQAPDLEGARRQARERWLGDVQVCLDELAARSLFRPEVAKAVGKRLVELGRCRLTYACTAHGEPGVQRQLVTDLDWILAVRARAVGGLLLTGREADANWDTLFGEGVALPMAGFPSLARVHLPPRQESSHEALVAWVKGSATVARQGTVPAPAGSPAAGTPGTSGTAANAGTAPSGANPTPSGAPSGGGKPVAPQALRLNSRGANLSPAQLRAIWAKR